MDTFSLLEIARAAMRQHSLLDGFSEAALRETAALPGPPLSAEPSPSATSPPVADLRGLLWSSIDNDDSRDLDQLTVARAEADGSITVFVAIADVDSLVRPGGAIDAHARANTTSVYTAAGVFAMLPERLSTDLTSLNEGVDRLAMVVEMTVAADGSITRSDVYAARVHNQAKLAYNSVAAWLDGQSPAPDRLAAVPSLSEQLRLQDRAAEALAALRRRHGALSLATPESRPVFTDGVLTDLRSDEGNRAKALIAGFMIAANGVTARFLDARGFPTLRRFLREPARWTRIVELAAEAGDSLPATPSAVALDAFLGRRREADPARFPELSLAIVKLLGSGEYMLSRPGQRPEGHFGLAVNDYTHSTAPNRRYPDLVTQRLLKAALAGAPPPLSDDELAALATHCTEQEDNAGKVERQVRKSAATLLLAPKLGQQFNGIVTGASAKGTWVRISHPVAEGRIVRGFEGLDVADKVRVTLVGLDAAKGFIDFERAFAEPRSG